MTSIRHTALWVNNLEKMRLFYERYFSASPGKKYVNPQTKFMSYLLTFPEGGILEIMCRPDIWSAVQGAEEHLGYAHVAIGVGSRMLVMELTESIRADGYTIISEPRLTGDGYFETVILDPEGNRVEITI